MAEPLTHWERVGPSLQYTNERAREMEQNVSGFARLVNYDLHALLKWAAALNDEIDRYRTWIDTVGRTCPSDLTVTAFLAGGRDPSSAGVSDSTNGNVSENE